MRKGGKAPPPPSLPQLASGVRLGGQPLSGRQEARIRHNTADEVHCVIPSLSAQLHPPPLGGGGAQRLGHLHHRRAPSYKEILLCQSSSVRQEGMCLSSECNVTTQKLEASKKGWQVVRNKRAKSYATPQSSETRRQ
jgi:hypothetical protein